MSRQTVKSRAGTAAVRGVTDRAAADHALKVESAEQDQTAVGTADLGRLGRKLKHARLTKGYTLRQLASEVACSESMVSKLENGKLAPSIAMLHRLAEALDTSMAELFAEAGAADDLVHVSVSGKRGRFEIDPTVESDGSWFERILPIDRRGLLQANILNIPPGASSSSFVHHQGEEFGYVLSGELEVIVNGGAYRLEEGDVIFFPSSLLHGYRNPGDRPARVLWVNTPPTL